MPTYEYECTRCGKITSEFKSMTAPRRQRCPSCRGKVELIISGGLGVVFKGDGFYINDSRKANRSGSKDGTAESGSAPKADGAAAKPGAHSGGAAHDGQAAGKGADKGTAEGRGTAESKGAAESKGTAESKGKRTGGDRD